MSNKDIEKELDRNLELLKQAEFDKKLSESIDKLRELSENRKNCPNQRWGKTMIKTSFKNSRKKSTKN